MVIAAISIKGLAGGIVDVLARVAQGEEIVIVQDDRPVAKIVPIERLGVSAADRHAAIERLQAFGKGRSLGNLKLKGLVEEGRL